jgi:hypothetical protein
MTLAAATLSANLLSCPDPIASANLAAPPFSGDLDGPEQRSPAAFTIQPLQARVDEFRDALTEAMALSDVMVAEDEGTPLDHQTVIYALTTLFPAVVSLHLPTPLFLPLQNRGIGAEWHASGMNIELRFRGPYDVYAVLEDVQSAISPYHGRDPHLVRTYAALRALSSRSTG